MKSKKPPRVAYQSFSPVAANELANHLSPSFRHDSKSTPMDMLRRRL